MALIWRKSMDLGNNAIDHDHRYLVCYINTVELALQTPDDKEVLVESLAQLYSYAYDHFMREEIIQTKIKYPEIQEHKQEHKRLLEQFMELRNKVKSEYSAQELEKQSNDLVDFLRHWLIDHVLNEDIKLKPYLKNYPSDLT